VGGRLSEAAKLLGQVKLEREKRKCEKINKSGLVK
jgi:hypothetical protein